VEDFGESQNLHNNNNNNNFYFYTMVFKAEWLVEQILMLVLVGEENRRIQRKTSQNRVENQQTQSTYDGGSGNWTRDILVEGEFSHHYPTLLPAFSSLAFSFQLYKGKLRT